MKFEVKWIPLENKRPPLYAGRVWVATKDGKVSLDEPVVDTYFGEERLKWRDKGFQDLAEYNNHECNWVTHWAKYVEPFPPDPPNALEPLLGPGDERYHGPKGKVMKVNKEALIANPPPEPSGEPRKLNWEAAIEPPAPDWADAEAREYLDANLGRATDTGIAALLRRVAERQREEDQSIVRLNARTHQQGIDLAAAIRKGKK